MNGVLYFYKQSLADSHCSSLWYSLLSGVLLLLATPLVGMWPLVWVAFVPFFLNYFALLGTRKIILAFFLMITPYALAVCESLFRLSGTWWVNDGGSLLSLYALEYAAFVFLVVMFGATFYFIPMLLVSKMQKTVIPLPILFALLFALAEFLRSAVFLMGYSWGALGYLLIDAIHIKHIASFASVYGLTFIAILGNMWITMLSIRYGQSAGTVMSRLREIFFGKLYAYETITVALLFIAVFLFGVYRESQAIDTGYRLRVAVISSNIHTDESINESSYDTYRSLFIEALTENPDLILTPENIFPYFTIDEEGYVLSRRQPVYLPSAGALYEDFLSLSKEYPRTTFALATHSEKNGRLFNSILLYRDGKVLSVYHKRRPVPFTEYAPLGLPIPLFESFPAFGTRCQTYSFSVERQRVRQQGNSFASPSDHAHARA